MKLMSIEINNFRGIRHASVVFPLSSRIVCLIGAGDSGKSTLLKAIEWVLWPSWNLIATDTDFYCCDISQPITITASIAEFPAEFNKEDRFGLYLRDFDLSQQGGDDEPIDGGIVVITIRLTIDASLEPKWEVITNRTEPRPIGQRDRRLLSFGVVGFDQDKDFQWGRSSVLQKYTDSRDALHNAFTQAMRSAVESTNLETLDAASPSIINIGGKFGVAFNGELHNKLLMQNGSYSTTVGIFDDKVPFSQRGLGSKRLLSIGMNVNAFQDGALVLVDEIETGLEPYRITTLINQFRTQYQERGQVVMTTHSRSAVCECRVDELCVVALSCGELAFVQLSQEEDIKNSVQAMIRKEPDAFLCKRVIVCEGKTEIGLLRAFEEYLYKKKSIRFAHCGVGYALGNGGDTTFKLANILKQCGYDVCILMDSDVEADNLKKENAEKNGTPVFCWQSGYAIEEQIFHDFFDTTSYVTIEALIEYATNEKSFDCIISQLKERFKCEEKRPFIEVKDRKIVLKTGVTIDGSTAIGTLAKDCAWYKRIDRGQCIGNIIFAVYDEIMDCGFKKTMTSLHEWVTSHES